MTPDSGSRVASTMPTVRLCLEMVEAGGGLRRPVCRQGRRQKAGGFQVAIRSYFSSNHLCTASADHIVITEQLWSLPEWKPKMNAGLEKPLMSFFEGKMWPMTGIGCRSLVSYSFQCMLMLTGVISSCVPYICMWFPPVYGEFSWGRCLKKTDKG